MTGVTAPRPPRRLELAWAAAVALLVAGLILGARNESDHRRQVEREAMVQADILAASVTAGLAFDDRDAIKEYVNALRVNPRVASAAVYDLQGEAIVLYAADGSRPQPRRAGAVAARTPEGGLGVVRPVIQQGTALGSVSLAMRAEPLTQVMARHSALALLMVMAFLLQGVMLRAASQLRRRAAELSAANERLTFEMQERAKAEEALRQSQKMEALGQLTGGIAHDFNNLLQVVQGTFELIRKRPGDPTKVGSWAENGLQATERGASLTRQLLTFSRAQKLDLQPFGVSEMIREMQDLITRTMGPAFEVHVRLDDTDALILADRTQLELAVLNLAINARDAMGESGHLTIATRLMRMEEGGHPVLPAADYVELSVTDTGPGMAPEIIGRAFEPFFTTKGIGKGTGLGLSQVYGVARQAGGEAFIESGPGGTRIAMLLRRAAPDADVAQDAAQVEAVDTGGDGPLSILIVDDDLEVRRVAAETLEVLGHTVRLADSGGEALAMLDHDRPDLVLMDFAMPGMNGAEVATLARQMWPDLPIVFASGYADTAAVEASVGSDAVILHKPFQVEQLSRTLSSVMARARAVPPRT